MATNESKNDSENDLDSIDNNKRAISLPKKFRFTSANRNLNCKTLNNFNKFSLDKNSTKYKINLSLFSNGNLTEKCLYILSDIIIKNYRLNRGTYIENFGTFTLYNNNIEDVLSNNNPIFILDDKFNDNLKPGFYNPQKGLIYYDKNDFYPNNIRIDNLKTVTINNDYNITKEKFNKVLTKILNEMNDKINDCIFANKKIGNLGIFLLRGNIFGMRFNNDLFNILDTSKKFSLFRSFNTVKNNDFDTSFRSTNNNRYKINTENTNYKRRQKNYKNLKTSCFSVSQRFYNSNDNTITEVSETNNENDFNKNFNRKFNFVRLKKIGISKENMEIIYNNKEKIIDNLKKNCDNYYRDYINKSKCEEIFLEINNNLSSEKINDIINIYAYDDEDDEDNNSKKLLNLVNYKRIINNFFTDMKIILNREKKIEIPKNNVTSNIFKIKEFRETEKEDNDLLPLDYENNLYKLKSVLYSILNQKCGLFKIYYSELISRMKEKNENKLIEILNQVLLKLKITNLKTENLIINLSMVIEKIEKILKENLSKRLNKNYNQLCSDMKKGENVLGVLPPKLYVHNKRYTNYDYISKTNYNSDTNKSIKKCITTNFEENKNISTILNNTFNDDDLIKKAIDTIKSKIEENGESTDKIAEYFDHILSYNFPRRENVIYLENFKVINKLENFNFSPEETEKIFKFFEKKNNNYIDRTNFIEKIKTIHNPIASIKKYIKDNNLTIFDIAYKMNINLYQIPYNELSNLPITKNNFYSRMKSLNTNFNKIYLYTLYDALLAKNQNIFNHKQFFEEFDIVKNQYNIKNNYTYENINENSEKIKLDFTNSIFSQLTYNEIRKKLIDIDPKFNGILSLNNFISFFEKMNIEKESLLHFLRMHELIDLKRNEVNYLNFLDYILKYENKNLFMLCVKILIEFLENECNKDLFIFFTKINGMNNNSGINEKINPERLLAFFKCKLEDVKIETVKKFDYNDDKFITLDDIKNIVVNYHDKNFFEEDKIKNIKDEIQLNKNNLLEENKKFFINLLQILKKNSLSKEKFFNFLDNDKNSYIDRKEFHKQLLNLPGFISFMNHKIISSDTEINLNYNSINEKLITSIDNFFDFLDEFNTNKVEINTFLNRLHYLEISLNLHEDDNNPHTIFILEELLFEEFCNWLKNNGEGMSPQEIFAVLDHDHDGLLENSDFRYFFSNYIMIPSYELKEDKLNNFKKIISITSNNSITAVDLQNLLKSLKDENCLNVYKINIINYCLKGNLENKIKYIAKDIGTTINKKYCNDINKAFNEYNNNLLYSKKDEGISYENFQNFIKDNNNIFEYYNLNDKEYKKIFNYISNNKKFIGFNEFKKLCHNNINNTDNQDYTEDVHDTDFYGNMHLTIKNYLNENFNSSEDSFKFFKNANSNNSNYITIKEFFNGINNLFPNKYETNTIINYFQITFKKNIKSKENNEHDKLNIITFNEFKEKYYPNDLNNNSKKIFLPPTNYSTQNSIDLSSTISENKITYPKIPTKRSLSQTNSINNNSTITDPLEKLKRMISFSDKNEKLKIIDDFINNSPNGTISKYEFYNLAKKFKLRLSNFEIEQITQNKKFFSDGCVNLLTLKEYLFNDKFIMITKKNLEAQFSEIKQLIIKYYSNPRLAFELNTDNGQYLSFNQFKNILHYLYNNEKKKMLVYPILKSLFDFIDFKLDGKIDSEEWNTVFSKTEGSLDKKGNNEKKTKEMRNWEMTDDVIKIYKLIAKNRKIIKEKFKLFSVDSNCLLIHSNDLVNILKEVLFGIKLKNSQWKLITSIGKKGKSDLVDFQTFINIIEIASKI